MFSRRSLYARNHVKCSAALTRLILIQPHEIVLLLPLFYTWGTKSSARINNQDHTAGKL